MSKLIRLLKLTDKPQIVNHTEY